MLLWPLCALRLEFGAGLGRSCCVRAKLYPMLCCLLRFAVVQTSTVARRAISHRRAGRRPCAPELPYDEYGRAYGRVYVLGDMVMSDVY